MQNPEGTWEWEERKRTALAFFQKSGCMCSFRTTHESDVHTAVFFVVEMRRTKNASIAHIYI